MQMLTNPFVWLMRIRHRCGYGVHSPFAFRFITDVIYEKSSYYAYQDCDKLLNWKQRFRIRRMCHLLFRCVNFVQPQKILVKEANPLVERYLQSGCNKALIQHQADGSKVDFCYLSSPEDELMKSLSQKSMLVVDNLRENLNWFKSLPYVLAFDLFDIGIALFDPKYNKQYYIVNF